MTPRRVLSTAALAAFVILAAIELLTQESSPSWLLVVAAFSAGCCLMALTGSEARHG